MVRLAPKYHWCGPVAGLSQLTSKPFVMSPSKANVVKPWAWAWTGGNGVGPAGTTSTDTLPLGSAPYARHGASSANANRNLPIISITPRRETDHFGGQ